MDPSKRTALIRNGNDLFRQGRIREATHLFLQANYADGLIRLGDFYFYEKNDLPLALQYYKKAKYQKGVDAMIKRIVPVIRRWLAEDETAENGARGGA